MTARLVSRAARVFASNPRRFAAALRRRARIWAALDYRFGADGTALSPVVVVLEITHRCNLRCKMCDLFGTGSDVASMRGDGTSDERALSLAEIARLFRELSSAKPAITISGGEPLLRRDIPDIVAEARRWNLPVTLVTNGMLLERYAERLVEAGLATLVVSIDGPASVHDEVRGVRGSFEKAFRGVRALAEAKARRGVGHPTVQMNATITGDSASTLGQLPRIARRLCVEHLVVSHLWFWAPEQVDVHNERYAGMCKACVQNLGGLDGLDVDVVIAQLRLARRAARGAMTLQILPELSDSDIARYYNEPLSVVGARRCISPWVAARILPDGELIPCLDVAGGNVRDVGFRQAWNSPAIREFRRELRTVRIMPACTRCCGLFSY